MPPAALGSGGSVVYLHYPTQSSMQAMYDKVAQGVPTGNCSPGPGQNTYTLASQTACCFACEDDSGQSVLAWTYDDLDILSVATSGDATALACTSVVQGGMGPARYPNPSERGFLSERAWVPAPVPLPASAVAPCTFHEPMQSRSSSGGATRSRR